MAQLAKALSNEWAGRNVQVNAIAPGYIATDNTAALRADAVRNPAILARIPAGTLGRAGRPRRRGGVSRLARFGLRQRHAAHCGWGMDGTLSNLRLCR